MTIPDCPKPYLVHGVSTEMLRGNEGTVYSPVWFIESAGSYFWTFNKIWTREDLRQLNDGEEQFVCFFPETERVPLDEGEQVYLAGEEFMAKILSFVSSGDLDFAVENWRRTSTQYYVSVMTEPAFYAFIEGLCLDLWGIVEKFLGGRAEKDKAEQAFAAYNAISFYSTDSKEEQSIRKAMFHMHTGNSSMLSMECRLSVEFDNFFATDELFHKAAKRRLDALRH